MANIKPVKLGNNVRMSFAKINEVLDMPNLIEVQKNSYQWFLEEGLQMCIRDRGEGEPDDFQVYPDKEAAVC